MLARIMTRQIVSGPLTAGVAYFAGVFAVGIVLGTVRTLALVPRLGRWGATLSELPVMLVVSWIYCSWLLLRFSVPATLKARLLMGSVAFGLLMIAEVMLGAGFFGRNLEEQIYDMTNGPGLLGLLGQIAFAVFPLALLWRNRGRSPR
jgi:hypothetical protein